MRIIFLFLCFVSITMAVAAAEPLSQESARAAPGLCVQQVARADAADVPASPAAAVSLPPVPAKVYRACAAFPTLVCHQGRPQICLQDVGENCDIEACVMQHEQKHLDDIAREGIDVCRGREDGQLAQTPYSQKVLLERSAIKVEQSCLQGLLRRSQGDCRRRVSERLRRVALFDSGCARGTENCASPIVPADPNEMVSFCSW